MATLPLAPLVCVKRKDDPSLSTAFSSLPASTWRSLPSRSRGGSQSLVGSPRGLIAMASYTVKLLMPDGKEESFDAPDDDYLLDTAEEKGFLLPASCRSGACSACCARLVEGEVDQADGSFLSDQQIKAGYARSAAYENIVRFAEEATST